MDIVYIGTPNNTHYDFIKKALLAGKHVLCEKPMVINREQFLELVNLAKEKQLILEEAYTPFHMPVMNKIKEAIDAGEIEEINAGDSEQAWLYEAYDFEQYIDAGKDRGELAMSYTIIKIMDVLRQSWKFKYPNELKIQENN
ncbi:Gfo/Idh/MocA family oxidoreductase [Lactobacillus helveticus]|nr:Gfo/Idh/MocA family oxidoreductase [Lactobacillus helveticus]